MNAAIKSEKSMGLCYPKVEAGKLVCNLTKNTKTLASPVQGSTSAFLVTVR